MEQEPPQPEQEDTHLEIDLPRWAWELIIFFMATVILYDPVLYIIKKIWFPT